MPSRQDLLHSYQFMVQRVVAALVMRETDPAQSPFRRVAGATLVSVLIAASALGVVGIYGALVGGGATNWRDPAAVIVEKESGARYVYREEKLHPVLNYASALLIVQSASPRTVLVSRRSIEGVPRGVPLGIADAPDSLPPADRLSDGPWTVCSLARDERGRQHPRSALLVGTTVDGGQALVDDAVLVQHPDGDIHLIWHQRRHLVRNPDLVFTALGWAGARPVPVAPALLNALPAGADLAPVPIADHGERSEVTGAKIGDVFVVVSLNGERRYAVAKRDGLAGITQVQAALLLTASGQDGPRELPPGRFARLPKVPDLMPVETAALPAITPRLVPGADGVICGQIRDDRGMAQVLVGARTPAVTGVARTGARPVATTVLVDQVIVAPGRGAVVEAVAAPGATGGAICVITDLGRRYPVASPDVLALLGYGEVEPLRLPAALVALVPAGQALDPEAARTPLVRP